MVLKQLCIVCCFLNFISYQYKSQHQLSTSESKKVNYSEASLGVLNPLAVSTNFTNTKKRTDTLWVFQNDTTVFRKRELMQTHPCSKPELITSYDLIAPIDKAYYFIYNEQQQLITEGQYTYQYIYSGSTEKIGNFYDSKDYYYTRNKRLDAIHYTAAGRNHKTEYFDKKEKLKRIRYFDKNSSDIAKIEVYKKGVLKETRIYTSFSKYYTIKASD